VSETNVREHHMARHRRRAHQRATTRLLLLQLERPAGSVEVRLIRVAPRRLDDDNLRGALKAIRDGVADWLGVDDGGDAVSWHYAQERGAKRWYAVRVEVVSCTSA
jgi:hypothetical protein